MLDAPPLTVPDATREFRKVRPLSSINDVPQRSEDLVKRLDDLIDKGDEVRRTHKPNPPNVIGFPTLNSGAFAEWQTQSLAFLHRVVGKEHVYTSSFEADVTKGFPSVVSTGQGILRALRQDLEGGYLVNVQTLVAGEVFSDFLKMARHLLEAGYKDPSASLAGAVLKDGLRRIGALHGVGMNAREGLTAMNTKLANAHVYSRLVQKQIAVWIDVRNRADHGDFSSYTEKDVAELVRGVRDFLATYLI